MDTVKITMLGPSRVGKTSLLAAMCDRFNELISHTDLQIDLGTSDAAILQEQLAQLKSIFARNTFESTSLIGTAPSVDTRTFNILLGKADKPASLQFEFTDYPGGYLTTNARKDEQEQVAQLVRDCAAVVIVIDAAALMEAKAAAQHTEPGIWNDMINRPLQVSQMFKAAYQNLQEPRMVLLAPVKCEKYKGEADSKKLCQTIETAYKDLLVFLKSKEEFVTVVLTPVQTLGTVVYSYMRVQNDQPRFFFQKENFYANYAPMDSEQPLRYLLRFFLKLHRDRRINDTWRVFRALRGWLGVDNHLTTAIQTFTYGCKDETNSAQFKVIQGQQWLKI